MYKFVKIVSKYGGEKKKGGFWYFVPNSVEQVIEHFNKIFGQEIKAGIKDKVGSIEVSKHPRQHGGMLLMLLICSVATLGSWML